MPKERPIKSFRMEGDRPFKSYNPAMHNSNLQFADTRKLDQGMLLPTTGSLLMQHHERYRQYHQDRQLMVDQRNQSTQQANNTHFIQSIQQQQNLQNALANSDTSDFGYDDLDLGDSAASLMRSDLLTPNTSLIHQREQDLNIPNFPGNSSPHNPTDFIAPSSVSALMPSSNVSLAEQDHVTTLFDNSTTSFSGDLQRPIDTSASTSTGSFDQSQFGRVLPSWYRLPKSCIPATPTQFHQNVTSMQHGVPQRSNSEELAHLAQILSSQFSVPRACSSAGNTQFPQSFSSSQFKVPKSTISEEATQFAQSSDSSLYNGPKSSSSVGNSQFLQNSSTFYNLPQSLSSVNTFPCHQVTSSLHSAPQIHSHQRLPQFVQNSPSTFYNVSTATNNLNLPGTAMSSGSTRQFPVKLENANANPQNTESSTGPADTPEQNSEDSVVLDDSLMCVTMQPMSSPSTSLSTTSHDEATPSKEDESNPSGEVMTEESGPDPTYREKRRKNNESAKRSREARRTKEEVIALRVIHLEQENMSLRAEKCLLDKELEELRGRLLTCR